MTCCNKDCQQGRDCPADQSLTDAGFYASVYSVTIAGLVAIAWAAAYVITHI